MAVVSTREIWRRLKLPLRNPASLVITPLFDKGDGWDTDSIDLRLGSYFLLPRISKQPYYCPDRRLPNLLHDSVHVPLGNYLVVPAHQTVLGMTLEFIKLPYDFSGEILTKSSVARTFIVVETAPWIHPLYRGCLTLEIANVSNTPLLLYPGRSIAQLILMQVRPRPPKRDVLEGTYLGPVRPEAAIFNSPAQDLRAIGVESVWVIPKPRLTRPNSSRRARFPR
jgi:dCTP deaminase